MQAADCVLDGTTYRLTVRRNLCQKSFTWSCDAPPGWEVLNRITESLIGLAGVQARIDSLDWRRKIELLRELEPRWRRDGMELFYLEPDRLMYRLMAVPIRLGSGAVFETSAAKPLFAFRSLGIVPQSNAFAYSVAACGQRFLVKTLVSTDEATLNVVVNWEKAAAVKER